MDKTKIFLVVVGVPSIKNYVFGTDRLIEIRGASALLDYLNREKTETFIKEHLANSEIKRVFANGGSAQFIVTAKEKDLNRCMELLRGYFHNETKGGLRLVWGKAEFIDNNYKAALDKAFLESERAEQELPIGTTAMIHTGYLRECDSCSGIASKPQQYQDDQRI